MKGDCQAFMERKNEFFLALNELIEPIDPKVNRGVDPKREALGFFKAALGARETLANKGVGVNEVVVSFHNS